MDDVIDAPALLEQIDGDVEFLLETLEVLESEGRELVESLQSAVGSGDAAAAAMTAHTLKGMVSNFCAPSVEEEARKIEHIARAGENPDDAQVAAFADSFEALCARVRQLAESIGG